MRKTTWTSLNTIKFAVSLVRDTLADMMIRQTQDIAANPVDMPGAAGVRMKLLVGREHGAPNFAMRQFEVEPGGHTPLHAHNYEHEVLILDGTGELGFNPHQPGRRIRTGDVLLVPANETHQFRNTSESPLRFICMVPVQFDCGQGTCTSTPWS